MKVVFNNCYGGFGLSDKALEMISFIKGYYVKESDFSSAESRIDPDLVYVVEKLGKEANTSYSNLQIKEIFEPYRIEEYDGRESVKHPSDYNFVYFL